MIVRSIHSVERLEQLLLLRILAGEFSNGAMLPTRTEICREYGVSRNTAGGAIGRLIARGLCVSHPGWGIEPVQLIHAIDHPLLLELIKQADDLVQSMGLLEQLLVVVRQLLTEAAASAAAHRGEDHLSALRALALAANRCSIN